MLVVIVPVLALFLGLRLRQGRPAAAYERRIEELRDQGEPMRMMDLVALFPGVPDDRDFARFLEESVAGYDARTGGLPLHESGPELQALLRRRGPKAWKPEAWAQLLVLVKSNAPVIEAVLAQDLDGFGFRNAIGGEREVLNSGPADQVFDRISLNKALAAQAAYEAEVGQSERAVTALIRGYQVARVAAPRGLVAAIGAEAGEAILQPALEQVLNRVKVDEKDLERLAAVLPRTTNLLALHFTVERARTLAAADNAVAVVVPGLKQPGWQGAGFRLLLALRGHGSRVRLLEDLNQVVAATHLPVNERLRVINGVDGRWAAQRKNPVRQLQALFDLDLRMRWELQPRFTALSVDDQANQNGLAIALAAVRVEHWRRSHGERIPESLETLGNGAFGPLPVDPTDGRPLRYRRVGQGYRIYAGGPNAESVDLEANRGGETGYDVLISVDR